MSQNKVTDPITDQEIAFALLILSGAMTDRRAAESVGLSPESAAHTKSKSRVRAYMLERRAAVQQQLVQQQPEGLRPLSPDREQVLARLWQIANLSPDMTRGSVTAQVKALSIIVAIENLIPDRRTVAAGKQPAPAPTAEIYRSAWLRRQQDTAAAPQPSPDTHQETDYKENSSGVPEPELPLSPLADASPDSAPSQPTVPDPLSPSQAPPASSRPTFSFVPDARVPFSINRNPFGRRR